LASASPDAAFVFYPGGLGINFVRQYAQLGLNKRIPLLSASTSDGITLAAQGAAALDEVTGSFWGPDFENPASRKFVSEFEAKFKRTPSQYAAQSYDAALLLDSAIAKVKGNLSDKKAFQVALKQADFESVRGSFKFNNNNFPIQDMHVFKIAKDDKGRTNLRTLATPLPQNQDAYHEQCRLK
jgi:branched-chain amino acid transport system substrate-binding protein